MIYIVCFVLIVLNALVDASPASCDENGVCENAIFVMRNGGNNTGEEPVLHETYSSYDSLESALSEWTASLYASDSDNVQLKDVAGRSIESLSDLSPNQIVFVVPNNERWIWPGIYIGFKNPLKNVQANGKSLILETISLEPRLFRINGFLMNKEADHIIELAKPLLERSEVREPYGSEVSNVRTSSNAWLPNDDSDEIVQEINKRVSNLIQMNEEDSKQLFEDMQVVHYTEKDAQRYESHADYFPRELYTDVDGARFRLGEQRMATVFYYLNDVEEGGETIFPRAKHIENSYDVDDNIDHRNCERGLKVKPRKGDAILWYNVLADGHMDGSVDVRSLHGACPVLTPGGEKWGANKWVFNKQVPREELLAEENRIRDAQQLEDEQDSSIEDIYESIDIVKDSDVIKKGLANDVEEGFMFRHTVDKNNHPWIDILRTPETTLSTSEPIVTLTLWRNGGGNQVLSKETRARIAVQKSESRYDIGEAMVLGAMALGLTHPLPPGVPCEDDVDKVPPFFIYNAIGEEIFSTKDLSDGTDLYIVDSYETWIYPGVSEGSIVSLPHVNNVEMFTSSLWSHVFLLQDLFPFSAALEARDDALRRLRRVTDDDTSILGSLQDAVSNIPKKLAEPIDKQLGQLLKMDESKHGGPLRLWRVRADQPIRFAPHDADDNRFATVLYAIDAPDGEQSGHDPLLFMFPYAGGADFDPSEPSVDDVHARDLCAHNAPEQLGALGVGLPPGRAMLVYHQADPRATVLRCSHTDGYRYVFEKAFYLTPRPANSLDIQDQYGLPVPAYDVDPSEEPKFIGKFSSLEQTINVRIFRVGGNNTGAEPYVAQINASKSKAAMQALLQNAAVKLKFVSPRLPSLVNATEFKAYDNQGLQLNDTSSLVSGSVVYVAPRDWTWVWPSVRLGYRRPLTRIPLAPDQPTAHQFVLETVSVNPRVFVVRNFLSPKEVKWLLFRGNQTIETPMAESAAPQTEQDPSTTWLFVTQIDDETHLLDKRWAALLRRELDEEHWEAMVVERFKGSKLQRRLSLEPFFDVESGHFDFVPGLKHGINRLAGVWAMLQEPEKGGDIVFPYGMNENGEPRMPLTFDWQHHRAAVCGSNDKPGTGGLRINLNAGDVVLWYSLHADAQMDNVPLVDRRTRHHHCAVTQGEKWGVFKFLHNRIDPTIGSDEAYDETLPATEGSVPENEKNIPHLDEQKIQELKKNAKSQ